MSRRGEERKRVIRGRQGNQEGDEKCSVLVVDEEAKKKEEKTGDREGAEQHAVRQDGCRGKSTRPNMVTKLCPTSC
ncbi:hypothetical protein CesoFtcFv8_012305 [Champsocephalus esox]|uniref:Uncharacterized protein n=2 Tax=Champsocephalus TaxID=52236 RepID=A0AAN8HNC2_CHAGU|nr:hypothetical protein CesoFtcFv8_012305 [Champsocephalus esox]KAK5921743.1 hypothetical protein CgunFtcFv8_019079 [Champsocephalus gunnari]